MQEARNTTAVARSLRRRTEHLTAAFRIPGVKPKKWVLLPDRATTRLVRSPVFVLSSVRSGSTLLRVLLNSHSQIRAPHELHLRTLQVRRNADFPAETSGDLPLSRTEMEHLLWDRVLHLELNRSGKDLVVDKTPANALDWRRIASAWPEARYIFLLRHPASVVESVLNRRKGSEREAVIKEIHGYVSGVEAARQTLRGLTVKYEDLTADPEQETRRICDYLQLPWERQMLDYGKHDHGPLKPIFGDWSANIKSGQVQEARPLPDPDSVPDLLRGISTRWGYLD